MELTKGNTLHGFTVRYSQKLPELRATLHRLRHEKSGADLVWLDRPDDNKTFSIGFKTIPQDDTGVFHILEHSVLCGSEKYPVREPFVELLKSSLQTFLNAMTFPDKTMYPLSSRNDQDFLNLIDVYLDAVLHPLSRENPLGFWQEGWHYELDAPEGELIRNGVVYNEMKGAFADPDEVLSYELSRALFPDNCYGYCSGGHPDHIPELTYENYLKSHARFYHPSNSYIFLDGELDLDPVLAKIAGFLDEYDAIDVDAELPMQKPVSAQVEAFYEIGPEDDGADKVILGEGWVYGTFEEKEKTVALSILAEVLCGSNEAPLKKALLDAGLAQDVSLMNLEGIQQNCLVLTVRNTSEDKKEAAFAAVRKVLEEQAKGVLDHGQLHAVLNRLEFSSREKDFGRMPRGLVFAMISMESWLYGGDPAQNLVNDETFRSLRRRIDEGWFEELIREAILDNPHHASVCLLPSATLAEEKAKKAREELEGVKSALSPAEIGKLMEDFAALRRHQSEGDTPEELATLPQLALSDIPEKALPLHTSTLDLEGTDVLHQDIETGGITYLDLYFKADDLTVEELRVLPLLTTLLGKLPTAKSSALEITGKLRSMLGHFNAGVDCHRKTEDALSCLPVVTVSAALLEERKGETIELLREVLLTTRFDDQNAVYNLLRQSRLGLEQAIIGSGNAFATIRAAAGIRPASAVSDELRGFGQLRFLQKWEKEFEERGGALCARLTGLCRRVFTKGRLVLSLTGAMDEKFLQDARALLPEGEMGEQVRYQPLKREAEGFSIPAGIGFAASFARLPESFHGSMRVAAKLLGLDHLWNNVRVKGGAYGVSMGVGEGGDVSFSSYRDPQCAQSLKTFAASGEALRSFCDSGESPDKYIISTIGSLEPVETPRQEKARAASMYFSGRTGEDVQRLRTQVLHTTVGELRAFSHVLDALEPEICVVGGKEILEACGDVLRRVESVQ